jgi:nucleotide-binding universal stress UspA family protein
VEVVATFQITNYWTDLAGVVLPSIEQIRLDLFGRTEDVVASVLAGRPEGAPTPDVSVVVAEGAAGDVLVQHGRTADLLVVGYRGHGAFRGLLLGSVALHCAMHAPCPVLVVRPGASRMPTRESVPQSVGAAG